MNIPLVDLKRQYANIKGEIDRAIQEVVNSQNFILGKNVEKFEEEYAKYCGTKHAVGVGSGLDALTFSLKALGIGESDEVITAANTFVATLDAISHAGAKPVLVDMEPETYNIKVSDIEGKITGRTKAIMPVHLYGCPAEIGEIIELAQKHDLKVIEDACQAHGAEFFGRKVGSFGDVGCFSFYPGKNLGCYGDGGIITTNDEKIKEKVLMLRNYGQKQKYVHDIIGYNSRLDDIQAAVLRVKLLHLDEWNSRRRENARMYKECLSALEDRNMIITPVEPEGKKHVFHIYPIQTENKNALREFLNREGIAAAFHYPLPTHLQKSYEFLGHKKGDFPETEKFSERQLSLPMFPELTKAEIEHICEKMSSFLTS